MSPSTAFANGAGVSITDVSHLIAGFACVAVLLWTGWAMLSTWRGWATSRVRMEVFQAALVRIFLVAVLIFWLFLS